jgi:hypothetical protein
MDIRLKKKCSAGMPQVMETDTRHIDFITDIGKVTLEVAGLTGFPLLVWNIRPLVIIGVRASIAISGNLIDRLLFSVFGSVMIKPVPLISWTVCLICKTL